MKKSIALLLTALIVLSALTFAACGGSGSSDKKEDSGKQVDEVNLKFTALGDLKKSGLEYEFLKADAKLEDDLFICEIKSGAEGDLNIPAEYNGKQVVAVTGEAETYDKVTSITIESGVSYVEYCLYLESGIRSIAIPPTVKGIYNSFSQCSSLTEISCPSGVKYIFDSFNACGALEKAETNGYVYGIRNSFCNDEKLSSVTFNGSIQKIEDSFCACGVTAITFPENIHDIINSFMMDNELESVVFEQIAGGVKDSFNLNDKLTAVTYKQGGEQILKSFNECAVLENVDFGAGVGSISDSFTDCPKYTLPEAPAE